MRALVVTPGPKFSVDDVCNGYIEALTEMLGEDGVEVFDMDRYLAFYTNLRKENKDNPDGTGPSFQSVEEASHIAAKHLEAMLFEWWPDVIFVVSGFVVPSWMYQIARSRNMRIVLIHTESPYEDDTQLKRAPLVDLNVLNDPTNIDQFTAVSNTIYLPHAYRPSVHTPGPVIPEMACDVSFVGTGYDSRVKFLEGINWSGIDLALGGHWKHLDDESPLRPFLAHDENICLNNLDTVDAYRSAKMSFNLYRVEAHSVELSDGWSMGPREVELAATGTFFARQPRPEGDELFPMLPTFTDPKELHDIILWALAHDRERKAAATAARAAIADRTFVNNATQIFTALGA